MNKIDRFENEYFFLSNYYETRIDYEGLVYESSEAAYQSAKVRNIIIRKTFTTLSADISKKLGRQLILREDWEDVKLTVMEDILRIKFSNLKLRDKLLATGDAELIESNWWNDTFWGVCNGIGDNHLGKLLVKIRGEL